MGKEIYTKPMRFWIPWVFACQLTVSVVVIDIHVDVEDEEASGYE